MSTCSDKLNRPKLLFASICILTLISAACTNQAETELRGSDTPQVTANTLLNSERIQMKYGSYGVDILHSDSTTRITSLYSEDGNRRITRTYAVVLYPAVIESAILQEHYMILRGGSIGQVFKDMGWIIDKQSIYFGLLPPSEQFDSIYEMMGGINPTGLALYMYMFAVEKDGLSYDYATIAEVYHPDYLNIDDINIIYAAVREGAIAATEVEKKLSAVRGFMSADWLLAVPVGE